jgi:hypothetical protein
MFRSLHPKLGKLFRSFGSCSPTLDPACNFDRRTCDRESKTSRIPIETAPFDELSKVWRIEIDR